MASQLTSVRLDDEQLENLRLLTELDGTNLAQVIRDAIDAYTQSQFGDPAFARRVEEANRRRMALVARFGQQMSDTLETSRVAADQADT